MADLTLDNQILRETSKPFPSPPVRRPRGGYSWRLRATCLQSASPSSVHTALRAETCGE